jgi:uncharacterized protein (DUF2126 family)/transglutaminase-like putative cysteine protease
MSIHVALHHRTHYRYDRPVSLGPQTVRLRPAPHTHTRILSYSLRVAPDKHFINWQQDPQSNYQARLVFPDKTRDFVVEVDLVAEMSVFNPFDFFLEPEAEQFPFQYDKSLDHELAPYLLKGPPTPEFASYLGNIRREVIGSRNGHPPSVAKGSAAARNGASLRTIDFLVAINQRLWRDIRYGIRLEPGVQTPEETLQLRGGSCRDSAWLLCQLLRHLGLASRFVSGYLIQLTADVKSLDGPSGPEKDFTDLHAWCEVFLPGAGWVGLDPTSGLLAGEGHIPLAATPDPQAAAPITGIVDESQCEFTFDMKVTRIHESPRVTRPYSDAQWAEIERLGHQVDGVLCRGDCRLTMGGEPTFVSIDDRDGAEWNTVALGPMKRRLAEDLVRRLKSKFTAGALLHSGQGKWYPDESLPRWALGCYWRKDGQPIWAHDDLLASSSRNYGFNEKNAEEFIYALARRLACENKWIMPAFEDTWYHLWKERRLPTNVDPLKSNLKDDEERARLARILERGLDRVSGYVLPLQRQWGPSGPFWFSGPWFLRPDRCYLTPGDSPMGLRLPLDSLPWVKAGDYPYINEQEPFDERPPLPPRPDRDLQKYFPSSWIQSRRAAGSFGPGGEGRGVRHQRTPLQEISPEWFKAPARGESAPWLVRTALCVEPRDGRMHIFMPPVRVLEDYLDVVAAVEDTAELLDVPVVVEGYTPPFDPRLNVLKVTPDPGVIEVNLHPTSSWDDMVKQTEILYEEARQTRLGTEKFMLDGRHTGTGGGNHIILGGATPADSPLLRRPELLQSLLTYWQNHPSLSFLFSSLSIGPTSQSPRIDEARNDSLYELGIAFRELERRVAASGPAAADGRPAPIPPWLVDRLFRNLLIDATGNTHRTEFCIDKLYAPESSSGRLGLLEMRAFEMPPHPRMSLAQQLLLRTLVARFWNEPYSQRPVRWGTDIHDRWMLPHFVWDDFGDVIEDLQQRGYAMKQEWFAPHFEFRFPQVGDLEVKSLGMELRQALEPWHVLGEEPGAGGTVRYLDSSLERVQVKVRGLVDTRHVVSVGGVTLPLHPTGTNGEYVAGLRFRAWQPPSCLHPTIGVHAPLVLNVVDTWNHRSLGGCSYHVMHPGGRSYDTFPVNAYEAESRRLSRFFRFGHTPGSMHPRVVERNPDFPFTLDLRNV